MNTATRSKQDSERFTRLYHAHHGCVLAYASRRVGPDASQDILAATYLAAWRRLDAVPEPALPWLYAAARLEIANWRRSAGREGARERAAAFSRSALTSSDPGDDIAQADCWMAALRSLAEGDREVLCLVAWEGLSSTDAATVLGCSATAFKVRLHRARSRLLHLVASEESGATPSGQPILILKEVPR